MAKLDLAVLIQIPTDNLDALITTCLRHRCYTLCFSKDCTPRTTVLEAAGLRLRSFNPADPGTIELLLDGNTAFLFNDRTKLQAATKHLEKQEIHHTTILRG